MYTQLLAVVRSLTDRVNSFETHPRQAEAVGSAEASLDHLPSFQEQRPPDAISLYAQGSLLGVGQDQGNPEGGRSGATSVTTQVGLSRLRPFVLLACSVTSLSCLQVSGVCNDPADWGG